MTSLEQKLQQLNLAAMSHQLEQTIAEAAAKNMSVAATLEWLADMELEARTGRAIDRRFKSSRLQSQPSIDSFQFHHHKSRVQAKNRILRLLDLTFLRQGTNLVLIGNPGVGKTFLAKTIGWKACQANQRVLFTTAMDMLNQLAASQVDHSLARKLKTYTEPTLLICDELGYLALDQQTSNLFYQVISTRHSQKRCTVITTNTPFSDWGNILFNTTIATAIADRLVENSEIFLLGGDSLRKANKNSPSPEEQLPATTKRRAVALSRAGGVRRVTPQRRCRWAEVRLISAPGSPFPLLSTPAFMFNFSANHLFLLSRTECRSCAVFLFEDHDTKRVYRLYDFTKALLIQPTVAYCVAGKVNSADKLYLVIESVRLDTKHIRRSSVPVLADGAGGLPLP
jgi:DNA replication protein DnaC